LVKWPVVRTKLAQEQCSEMGLLLHHSRPTFVPRANGDVNVLPACSALIIFASRISPQSPKLETVEMFFLAYTVLSGASREIQPINALSQG
jgi:hypothetical protein